VLGMGEGELGTERLLPPKKDRSGSGGVDQREYFQPYFKDFCFEN